MIFKLRAVTQSHVEYKHDDQSTDLILTQLYRNFVRMVTLMISSKHSKKNM